MANRKNTFLLKRSNVVNKAPSLGDIQLGEIALNTADAKLFSTYTGGLTGATEIREIGWDRLSTISGGTVNGDVIINADLTVTGDTQLVNVSGTSFYTDYIDFNNALSPLPTDIEGRIYWDEDNGTVSLGMHGGQVVQQVGLEQYYYVKNQSGATIDNGRVVRAAGTLGSSGRILGEYMIADGTIPAKFTLGIATENIVDGDDGYVTEFGLVRGIDASGSLYGESWSGGTILYVSPTIPGGLTSVEPTAPDLKIEMAIVIDADVNGSIFVRPDRYPNIYDLQEVNYSAGTENNLDILQWNESNLTWDKTNTPSFSGLTVYNNINHFGDYILDGDISQTGNYSVTGDTTINGNLDVTGDTILGPLTATSITSNSAIDVFNGHINIRDNSYFLQGRTVADVNVSLIGVDNQDRVFVGNAGYDTYIDSNTIVNGALTADTFFISNTPTLNSGGTDILIRNSSTGEIEYRPVSGITPNTNTFVTGGTYNESTDTITLTRNDAVTVDITGVTDTFTTGSTYDNGTALATFTKNDGTTYTLDLSTIDVNDTFVTGFTYDNANTFTISRNDGVDLSTSINTMTGLTVNGTLVVDTISATTYTGLTLTDLDDVTSNIPTTPDNTYQGRLLYFDVADNQWVTGEEYVSTGNVTIWGKKGSAGTIDKGCPVYITGFDNDIHEVELANATTASTMPVIGFTGEDFDNAGVYPLITFGKLVGVDTTSTVSTINPNGETWTINDVLYMAKTDGGLTKFRPSGTNTLIQRVAKVLKVGVSDGQLFIFNTAKTAGLPNLTSDYLWVGNGNDTPQEVIRTDVGITTTGFTYNDNNTLTITDDNGGSLSTTINQMSGLTINGDLDVTGTVNIGTLGTGTSINTLGIDSNGYVVSGNTSSSDSISISYFNVQNTALADNITYRLGQMTTLQTSINAVAHIPLPAGTITEAYIVVYNASTFASGENITVNFLSDGGATSNTLSSTVTATSRHNEFIITGLSISINAGRTFIEIDTPAFTTNPTAVQFRIGIKLEL